jgi:hypothetical protein
MTSPHDSSPEHLIHQCQQAICQGERPAAQSTMARLLDELARRHQSLEGEALRLYVALMVWDISAQMP